MKISKNISDDVDKLIQEAGDYTEKNQPRIAIEKLLSISKDKFDVINSDNYIAAGLYIELGMAYYDLDKLEGENTDEFLIQAVKYFTKFLGIKEASENVLFMRAKCYDYLGQFDNAKADYERVIQLNPTAKNAHAFLALLMENEGYLEEAKKLYKMALSLDKKDEMSKERLSAIEKKGSESA